MTSNIRLSILIPSADRSQTLASTLAAFKRQKVDTDCFEVIVADNRPSTATRVVVERAAADSSIPIHYLEAAKPGPAAARNAAARKAAGDILMLAGDDTEPADSTVISQHLELHARHPSSEYAVLGRIAWSPKSPPTEFMLWLENGGPQFHYGSLAPGEVPASRYFYSSHLSLKKSLFDQVGGFDERFPYAAVEDTELGCRLEAAGMRLEYRPELLFHHDHPTTLEQSLKRAVIVGRAAAIYNRLNPDSPHPQIQAPRGPRWTLLRALAPVSVAISKIRLPERLQHLSWLAMHRANYAAGYSLETKVE